MKLLAIGISICMASLLAHEARGVTNQQNCDFARITAWKTYFACIESAVAKDAKFLVFDDFAAVARCRHAYLKKWNGFQTPRHRPFLVGSTCIGTRFVDNADQTVTDNLTMLVWEKKDNRDGMPNSSDPHDADNKYYWGLSIEDGTAFSDFLANLNSSGFAGANGWRLPTMPELATIVLDFACRGEGSAPSCTCPTYPCIDPALDANNTVSGNYYSATGYLPDPNLVWSVDFGLGDVGGSNGPGKASGALVRAVRGGL